MDRTVAVGLAPPPGPLGPAGLMARGTGDVLLETARRFADAHRRLGVEHVGFSVDGEVHEHLRADGLLDAMREVLQARPVPVTPRTELVALARAARHHRVVDPGTTLLVELDDGVARVARLEDGHPVRGGRVGLRDLRELAGLAAARPDGSWLDVAMSVVRPLWGGVGDDVGQVVLAGAPAVALGRQVAGRTWRRPVRVADGVTVGVAALLELTLDSSMPEVAGAAVVGAGLLAERGLPSLVCTDADRVEGHLLDALGSDASTPLPVRLVEATGTPTPQARHVADLAVALFDGLHAAVGLVPGDRDVLEAAALLHDLARAEGPGHHRRAAQRILDLSAHGVSPRDLVEVACVVRSQRGRAPGGHVPVFLRLPAERRAAVGRLVALLRLAIGLDRGGDGAVEGVHVTIDDAPTGGTGLVAVEPGLVCVEVFGDRLDLALYGARGAARYVEHALGVRLVVRTADPLAATP